MPTPPPPETTMQPARYVTVNLLDLPHWLDRHHCHITHVHIVGTKAGQLWIEAETRSDTATASEGGSRAQNIGTGPHHQERRGQTS